MYWILSLFVCIIKTRHDPAQQRLLLMEHKLDMSPGEPLRTGERVRLYNV